jgi:hypothetical protein
VGESLDPKVVYLILYAIILFWQTKVVIFGIINL